MSCSPVSLFITTRNLLPLTDIVQFAVDSGAVSTGATNIQTEPSTIMRGVDQIGSHVEVRVEASNVNSESAYCAFQVNIKGKMRDFDKDGIS